MRETWKVAPVLRVSDVRASAAHYRDVLGFELRADAISDGIGDEGAVYAILRRGGIEVHLGRARSGHTIDPGERPNAIGAYLRVADVEALHAEFRASGADIVAAPAREPWGEVTLLVRDPDGYLLSFASPGAARS